MSVLGHSGGKIDIWDVLLEDANGGDIYVVWFIFRFWG